MYYFHNIWYNKFTFFTIIQTKYSLLRISQLPIHTIKAKEKISLMKARTQKLLEILTSGISIETYYRTYEQELQQISISDWLENLLEKKKLKKASVIKSAELDRTYGYQLFNGTRKPSRDSLICLGMGMMLSLDELQILLKVARFAPLYAKDQRDSAIIFFVSKKKKVCDLDAFLLEQNLPGIIRI